MKIKTIVKTDEKFKFKDSTPETMFKKIISLDAKKGCMKNDIPTKLLLGTNDIVSKHLSIIYNNAITLEEFPQSLKTADVTPLSKGGEKDSKKNYRPVSLTPILSKVFEKDMYEQILQYSKKFLSQFVFGYRAKHNSELCLVVMIEMWKKALDEHKVAGAVLTDLSKAFDCIPHDLLIAKLHAYGFDKSSLNLVLSYLSDRTQRVKVNGIYSRKRKLSYGVPQGSILGPLLFNLFMNDIFYFVEESKLANYADDTTIYTSKDGIFPFLHALLSETEIVLDWFKKNEMKSNSDKCHMIVAENEHRPAYVSNTFLYLEKEKQLLQNEECVKLLGVWIDDNMTFEKHILTLLKKANQKLHALMRIAKYMSDEKLRILMKTFIESQFNYCPLVWMFHSRKINEKINKLHERALRVVYSDDNLTFEQLLEKDNSFDIHDRNLQKLAILMFKVKNNLCPKPIQDIFKQNINDNWIIPKVRTETNGKETLRYRGPTIWNLIPDEIRSAKNLESFKAKVSKWKPEGCTCKLCKTYIKDIGYI